MWSHTPSNATLIWLWISLPVVIWDTGYVLGRPYTFPGGKWHAPIWTLYAIQADLDYTYGLPAFEAGLGWPAAQGWFNAIETLMYGVYLYIVYKYGKQTTQQGRGAPDKKALEGTGAEKMAMARTLEGRWAGIAVVLGLVTSWLTFTKTVLYCELPSLLLLETDRLLTLRRVE